jgi:uroporphyrin-III C-methyltransferase/precorrin-2 dehydrogenase/sirohydrochlorin ferrochelatase
VRAIEYNGASEVEENEPSVYPITLDVRGQRCLVVGAGAVALRKIQGLLAEEAQVTVVAPAAIEAVLRLADEGAIALVHRAFVEHDVEGCRLVFVATGNRAVDEAVAAAAKQRGIWTNVADVPDLCDFHLPSVIRRGDLHLAIASAGKAPFATRRMRELLERKLGPEWADWTAAAHRFRRRVQQHGLSGASADAAYDRFMAETVDAETLAVRASMASDEAAWIHGPRSACPATTASVGRVSLVGAGPGNPGLLTVAGLDRLRHADAVLYDRLAIPAIPLDLPDHVELFSVGKQPGHHPVPQAEIETLLVRLAREGKRVVRLKGGDPFVFARGGEEALALKEAGIPCETIPGITAGIAVPAAAGIPVTFRGQAVRLTFITAHEGGAPQARWDLLARDAHATLVGYMGVSNLAAVSTALLAAGMPADTPAALVAQGTLPGQRLVRAPLAELATKAESERIEPPAIFVIGKVAAYADQLASWLAGPLRAARVAMFAPEMRLGAILREAGAQLLVAPVPLTKAARLVLGSGTGATWIVRSTLELDILGNERLQGAAFVQSPVTCTSAELAGMARDRGWSDVAELDVSASENIVVDRLRDLLSRQTLRPASNVKLTIR